MKYSASGRQPLSVLHKVDEIRLDYDDIDKIYDFFIDFEEEPKDYVIKIYATDEVDWTKLYNINEASKGYLTLTTEILEQADLCKSTGAKWYWGYPITSYWELNSVMRYEPSQLLLGAPLYFDLPEVKKRNVPIRLVADLCDDPLIPHENGVCGPYVRPEDISVYEKYVDTLEFARYGKEYLKREESLIDIYQSGNWPGNLNLLLLNLGEHVDNRAIPEQFGEARVQCRQACMRNSHCRLCKTLIKFSQVLDKNNPQMK